MADQVICLPPNVITRLRAYLNKPDFLSRPLTADAFQRTVLVLGATLSEGTTSGTDKYRVDPNFIGLIYKIRPHIRGISMGTTEALTYSGTAVVDPEKVRAVRAMNCNVSLELQGRNEFVLGTQGDSSAEISLYDIDGEREIDFGEDPQIVPPGETLALKVELQDGDNALECAAGAEYGVLCLMTLLRHQKA